MLSFVLQRPLARLLAPALVLVALPGRAAPPPLLPEETVAALAAELSGTEALYTVQELTLHHRMRGSEGYRAAAEAIRERLERYGLSGVEIVELPADGEVFYGTQRSRPAWDADFAELWELDEGGRDAERIASYALRPVTLAQDSVSGEATAELVDVGAGTAEEDYEGIDVAGELVLTSSQPGAIAELAVGRHGAAGIVSWAQNQKSAWWGMDETLVRWGHLDTFDGGSIGEGTFAFMVSPARAAAWRERLAAGERVRLRAEVRAGRHPGVYAIPTATIPGADPGPGQGVARQEIVYSCHLDHQRPGANDDASGCATILEVARALAKLVREGEVPPPRRTLRFVWPPEIEGTIALLNARPEIAARARAVIHLDMVGGDPETTKAVFHVTRSPASLPTVANDVAEAFARWVNDETYEHAATGAADFPLIDPEGGREPLRARIAPFSMGSDHQVWAEGSFRVPAIYMNDWPDRYIHTHADRVGNLDPTKLLRAAFLAAASGYTLATLDSAAVPELLAAVRRHAMGRTADAMARAAELPSEEAASLLWHRLADERAIVDSVARFAPPPPEAMAEATDWLEDLGDLVPSAAPPAWLAGATELDPTDPRFRFCARAPEPKGPLWGFGYSFFDDRLAGTGLARPALLSHRGPWGGGGEYAYEVLNRIDGRHLLGQVRDAVAGTYGPVPLEVVDEYFEALERIGVIECDPELLDFASAPTGPLAERTPAFPPPEDPRILALAGFAKVVCSAVFVSGRDAEEAARNSAIIMLPGGDASWLDWTLDEARGEVRATGPTSRGEVTRTARFHGDQGCTILPLGADGVAFEPTPVQTGLPPADSLSWPMGDLSPEDEPPGGLDEGRLAAAEAAAFADPEAMTAAFVAVHRGRIVAERYAEDLGIGPETQLESWSMGKSLTATLVGRLIQEGAFGIDDPAPVPDWREPGDPRGAITVSDLLRMSSGLHCTAPRDPDYSALRGYPEHMYIYTGAIDLFGFATSRPLQFPPGTEGRYRNCDPLTLGYLVKREAEKRGLEYLSFPQRLLFDRIGIRRQVLEVDPYGNFSLTGFDYGTARNWARLGMLYLQDGVWHGEDGEGERLLPEGWGEWVSTPAPAWDEPVYGGLFWLNLTGTFDLPRDAYYMAGAGGQYVIVVPSLDLVVVRLGHLRGGPRAIPALNGALRELVAAIEAGGDE